MMHEKSILLLCRKMEYYKGVERQISFSDFREGKNIIQKYLSLVDDDGDISFSAQNLWVLREINTMLSSDGLSADIIFACSEKEQVPIDDIQWHFLGFDVSGDSFYHSPLYRAFFETPNNTYFQDIRNQFSRHLNNNGLFADTSVATLFAKFIQENNKDSVFEDDEDIRPLMVFGELT